MARKSNTTVLTQGAILTAIYLILLLIVVYVPFLNLVLLFFLPVPFIIHTYKHGWQAASMVGLAALFLTPILTPLPTMLVTFFAASVGLVMGYFYAQKKGAFTPIIAAIMTYIANYLLTFLLAYVLFQINVIEMVQQMMEESFALTEGTVDFLNLPVDDAGLEQYKQAMALIPLIFPSLMIMSSMLMGFIHHWVSKPILSRVGCQVEPLPPFREWSFPRSLLFYYLISLLLVLVGLPEESTIYLFVANLHPILEILLLLQGLSVIAYFAHWKKIGKALPIIAVVMLFLVPVTHFIFRFLGIFELGFGLKQRMKQAE